MRTHPDEPERRCILTGGHGPRDGLIRLALGPDGLVHPDLGAKAGGRGAWLGVSRPELEQAQAKGRLKGALARAFKSGTASPAPDLAQRIEAGLARRALDRLGLEYRAGNLILGTERIGEALASGAAGLFVHADDAGQDSRQGLSARAANNGVPVLGLPAGREVLSMALGRANSVYLAAAPTAATRVASDIGRWRAFLGLPIPESPAAPPAGQE